MNAFIVGAVIMALEMIGSRFLTPYFGSSIYTWASIISIVLLALTCGYFAGGYLADNYPSSLLLGSLILCAAFYTLFIPFCADRLFDGVYGLFSDIRYSSLVGAFMILFLPLALLGVYSPFAIRLTLTFTHQSGRISGYMYGISTFGSIVGTLGVTFYLIPLLGSRTITYTLSLIAFMVGVSFLWLNPSERPLERNEPVWLRLLHSKYFKIFIVTLLYLAIFSSIVLSSSDSTLAWTLFNTHQNVTDDSVLSSTHQGILEHVESEYNNIMIYKHAEYITMKFSRHQAEYTESTINTQNAYELPVDYTRVMPIGLVYVKKPTSLLMIGLGGGSTTRYIHTYLPQLRMTVVEIDKRVIELAKKYFHVKESSHYNLIENDGRMYIKNDDQTYDIIMMDAFRGGYIPFHLLTKEFNELVKKRLNEDGCFVVNLQSGTQLFDSIMATLHTSFDHVDTFGGTGNVIAVAYQGSRKRPQYLNTWSQTLQARYEFYYDMTKVVERYRRVEWDTDSRVLTDDFAPANYLHAIQHHNRKQW
jgi:spermidine synthase